MQFDLTPAQLEAFRYSNTAYENFTPEELRRTYIQIGGAAGATNFDRNAQILNNAELAIYRDNNPDLANLSDFELRQHFIQFGRQEMLQGTRPKIDALIPDPSQYAGLTSIQDIAASRLETPRLAGDTKLTATTIAGPGGTVPAKTDIATTTGQVTGDRKATFKTAGQASVATAAPPPSVTPSVTDTTKTATDVRTVTDATTGATKTLTQAKPDTALQIGTQVAGLKADTGTAQLATEATRLLGEPELITPAAKKEAAAEYHFSVAKIKENMILAQKLETKVGSLLKRKHKVKELNERQKEVSGLISTIIMANEDPQNWIATAKDYIKNPVDHNQDRVHEVSSVALEHQVNDYLAGILYASRTDSDGIEK